MRPTIRPFPVAGTACVSDGMAVSNKPILTAGDRAYNKKRLRARCHRFGQGSIRRFMREILLAGKESYERPALMRNLIADGAAQHRITRLQRIEHGALRGRAMHIDLHLDFGVRQCSQMARQHHAYHGSVWTSTDSTAGRSRTIGAQ
jgi:hypothetical protein